MKNYIKSFALIAITALAFAGCAKEMKNTTSEEITHYATVVLSRNDVQPQTQSKTAVVEGQTSASFKWLEGDKDRLHVYENGTEGTVTAIALSDGEAGEKDAIATLTVGFTGTPTAPYTYKAVYGSSVSSNGNPLIPAEQHPEVDNFDPDADVLISREITNDSEPQTSLSFTMGRVVTVNKMTLTGLESGEKVSTVEFELDAYLSSRFTGRNGDGTSKFTGSSKKLTFHYNNITVPSNGELPVYFIAAPVSSAGIVGVVVTTDKNVYTKTSSLDPNPFSGKTLTLEVGRFTRFNMGLADYRKPIPTGVEYTLVESSEGIFAGGRYLFVSNKSGGGNIAASTYNDSKYYNVTDVTVESKKVTITSEAANVFTLEASGTAGQYYIKDNTDNYLVWNSGNAVEHNEKSETDAFLWSVGYDEGATIVNVGDDSRKLQYNSGSPRFACYSSNQTAISLYVQSSQLIPTLATPEFDYEVQNGNSIYLLWDAVANASSYTITCTGKEDITGVLGTEYTITGLTTGTYTVTITAISGDQTAYHNSASASETILIGTPSLGQPVIKSFTQTSNTTFSAEINAAVEHATSYDWALYAGSASGSSIVSGNTENLSFNGSYDSFAVGTTYYLVVTAKAVGYNATASEAASFIAKNVIDYSTIHTSNVTLTTAGGTSASAATVNGYDAIKAGTGSIYGAVVITVPAGTTEIHLHAAAWNGKACSIDITGATASPSSLSLTADSGVKDSSPFTLSGDPEDYYFKVTLSSINSETPLTFTATGNQRFVIWGVNVPDDREPLDTPTGLAVSGKVLSWNAVSGAASYQVTVGETSSSVNTNSYTFTGTDDYYDVSVVAVPTNTTTYKNSEAATLSDAKFGTPTLTAPVLSAGVLDETSVQATWTLNAKATNGYHAVIKVKGNDAEVDSDDVTTGSVTFDGLSSDTEYTVFVYAKAVSGEKAYAQSSTASIDLSTQAATTIADVIAGGGSGTFAVGNVTVFAAPTTSTAIIGDATGKVLLYTGSNNTAHNLSAGDVINVSGSTTLYNGIVEFSTTSFSKIGSPITPVHGDATALTSDNLTSWVTTPEIVYISGKGKQSGRNISVFGKTLYLNAAQDATNNQFVEFTGYLYGWSTNYTNFSFIPLSISAASDAPTFGVSPTSKQWEYNETNATSFTVTATNGSWDYSPKTLSWASVSLSGNVITVTPNGNNTSTTDDNTGTITVTFSPSYAGYSVEPISISLTQKKQSSGGFTPITVWDDDFSQFSSASTTARTSLNGSKTGYTSAYSGVSTIYAEVSAIKFASNKAAGSITTPAFSALTSTSTVTVTIEAAGMNAKTGPLTFTVNNAGTASKSSATVTASGAGNASGVSSWDTITFTITGATSATTLTLSAASGKQVFVNSINIVTTN